MLQVPALVLIDDQFCCRLHEAPGHDLRCHSQVCTLGGQCSTVGISSSEVMHTQRVMQQMQVNAGEGAFCVKATGPTRVATPAPASCHEKMSWMVFGCVVPNARSRVCAPVSVEQET